MSPIRTLLVANRGEVARRVFRTCRELGVRTVAVYSPPDAGAPFVAEADAAVPLDGTRGYLDIAQILAAARATGADAVHPGWGFLAENAPFAEACIAAGLIWVGPPPAAMESMGSKIEARRLMEAAGVPVVPGATLSAAGDSGSPSGLPTKDVGKPLGGPTADEAAITAAGARVGFPLLVKASAGGGGKGMRLVNRAEELAAAVADAAREARASFGDPAVFLERYVSPGRHVEVQILGDHHGTVVHLFERDCSVQRRHQKLVEESPSPAVDDDLRARMGQAAVAAAEAVGYHGVGTVEFLLGPDGDFYFLEMNTRLQVEHPVTELVTGLDLVRLQLAVAEGRPLPPEVHAAAITGHAVEVRLYAEDPLHDYQPQTGRVEALEFPALPGLRVDSGVEAGSVIGTDYDSMLAKVIVSGPTRAEAVRFLVDALRRARIHGVGTNRDLLLAILDHDEFGAGTADTGFLDRHPPDELLAPTLDPRALGLHALAAALAAAAAARAAAPVLRPVGSGFRNNPGPPAVRRFTAGDTELVVGYRLGRAPLFTVDGDELAVTLLDGGSEVVELVVDGVRRRFDVRAYEHSVHVDSALGSAVLRPVGRFPAKDAARPSGSLVAPMPGTVVKVLAAPGDSVRKGDPVVVIEAMKMEHTIGAAGDGTVAEILVDVGRQVDLDQVIAVITVESADEDGGELRVADLDALGRDALAEHDDLRAILLDIPPDDWERPTPAAGWTIRDQLSHLAYFDGAARLSMVDPDAFRAARAEAVADIEKFVAATLAYGRGIPGSELLDRFAEERRSLVDAARAAPEGVRIPWYGPDMAVASSITARIMETWAHGQDVADALGVVRPPTARIRHVCDIGIRARPFSYRNRGLEPPATPLRVELIAPDGGLWEWGPPDAADRVTGPALDFALLVTQRRLAANTALVVEGDDARTWIGFAQAFAGNPTDTDPTRKGLNLPG